MDTNGIAVEEVAFVDNDDGQQWESSIDDDDDSSYFTLKNPRSGKLLTKTSTNTFTIKAVSYTHLTLPTNREV